MLTIAIINKHWAYQRQLKELNIKDKSYMIIIMYSFGFASLLTLSYAFVDNKLLRLHIY